MLKWGADILTKIDMRLGQQSPLNSINIIFYTGIETKGQGGNSLPQIFGEMAKGIFQHVCLATSI